MLFSYCASSWNCERACQFIRIVERKNNTPKKPQDKNFHRILWAKIVTKIIYLYNLFAIKLLVLVDDVNYVCSLNLIFYIFSARKLAIAIDSIDDNKNKQSTVSQVHNCSSSQEL